MSHDPDYGSCSENHTLFRSIYRHVLFLGLAKTPHT